MEDGVRGGGDVGTAELAAVDLAASDAVVVGDPITLGAMNPIGPPCAFQEVQAGIVVWKLGVELLDRVLFHALSLAGNVRAVKV